MGDPESDPESRFACARAASIDASSALSVMLLMDPLLPV